MTLPPINLLKRFTPDTSTNRSVDWKGLLLTLPPMDPLGAAAECLVSMVTQKPCGVISSRHYTPLAITQRE